MQDFKGKVAVVTGGNSGIGLGIARALAAEGCNLLLVGMDEAKAQNAATALEATGVKAVGISCDVTKREAVEAMADFAFETFGAVDILVNNAGVGYGGEVYKIGEQDWESRYAQTDGESRVAPSDLFVHEVPNPCRRHRIRLGASGLDRLQDTHRL